jgi:hypothetical protein
MTQTMKVSEIKVGKRHRKDLGDIAGLAASIRDLGQLIQPIAVWPDGTLAAGERRLAAVKELGWEDVPVYVLASLDDLLQRLKTERDENTERKAFTPSEAVALGAEIEELERKAAKERQRHHGGTAPGKTKNTSGNLPEVSGDTRDKTAEAVGMSGRTYEKAKAVVEAAEADPEMFGDLAEVMDRTGKVDGAFREMEKRRDPPPPKAEPQHPHSDLLVNWLRIASGQTLVINTEMGGISALLAEPGKWDWREVREYVLPMLDAHLETITRFRREIGEHASQQGHG